MVLEDAPTMKTQRLILPDLDPKLYGLNETYAMVPHQRNRIKRQLQEYIGWRVKMQKLTPIEGPVWIDYLWVMQNKKRDKSNIAAGGRKIIEDALCPMHPKNNPMGAGILRGDDWDDIVGWTDAFGVDKTAPRVELTITEMK